MKNEDESMDLYRSKEVADECLEHAKEMFNEPDAGRVKKTLAVGLGILSGWQKSIISVRSKEKCVEKGDALIRKALSQQKK